MIRLIENWKKSLDKSFVVASALLIDLSEVFDCVPYDFLVVNLLPFDISSKAVNFICSDLKPRRQKVRVFLVLFKPFFRECHKRPILFARLWDLPNFNLLLIPINYYIKYLIKSYLIHLRINYLIHFSIGNSII